LHDDDFFAYAKDLGLDADQLAWVQAQVELAGASTGMAKAMKLDVNGVEETDHGWLFHRQPLTRPVAVQDPRSLKNYQVKIDEGPVLRSRYGATQTAGKHRDIRTKAEGVDAG